MRARETHEKGYLAARQLERELREAARVILREARTLIEKRDYPAAGALADEVESFELDYRDTEDSPSLVRDAIKRANEAQVSPPGVAR
jgi:hypothetical protein